MDDLLADFLTETNEGLAELDLVLIRLEQRPDDLDALGLAFRVVHTVKGTCGFLGLARLEKVTHAAESVLGRLRDGQAVATPDVVALVLGALDRVRLIVGGLEATETEPPGDDSALIHQLETLVLTKKPAATAPVAAPQPVQPAPVAATVPVAQQPAADPVPAMPGSTAPQTIRVGVTVLEGLMTLVSELVLTRNQLLQLARTRDDPAFAAPLQRLNHITSDLHEGIMQTRMQPVGQAWNKLPRLVHDLARELDKRIDLVMEGEATELDRQVIELIRDPLTHMVRNSADHGLESPADRLRAGKPEAGRIRLNAFHEGGRIVIQLDDDGRGLDLGAIRARALRQGLVSETALAGMSDAQVYRFIFRPGFSTAAAVTSVSGRGVGMDVVRTNIEQIGGTIELTSVPGSGTCFMIKIPLTLAIVSALVVAAGGERFAIPQTSVVELVRAGPGSPAKIERIDGTAMLRLRSQLLPLIQLDTLLRLDQPRERDTAPALDAASTLLPDEEDPVIVIASVGGGLVGIVVDQAFDTEEIVVKPVAPVLRHVTMFSGTTILGDGAVIMILDPGGIARASGLSGKVADRDRASIKAHADDDDSKAMLLFETGGNTLCAVPLALVARLEELSADRIEGLPGRRLVQYRDRLMPLVSLEGPNLPDRAVYPTLVFAQGDRCLGLVVDRIVDVLQDRMHIQLGSGRPGVLGTAVIAGRATDILDTGFVLARAWPDWFSDTVTERRPRILVVEDSDFFRQLLAPTLSAAGYEVTLASNAGQALALQDSGAAFDAIVSDIEMPGLDGLGFVRQIRQGGAWSNLPIIALSGRVTEADREAGRLAGFNSYVVKFDRDVLLGTLAASLGKVPA